MQTIVAFTDFSQTSENTIRYALHLARKIKTNVLITELIISNTKSTAMEFAGSTDEPEKFQVNNNDKLIQLCTQLENELVAKSSPGSFQPVIYCHGDKSSIENTISLLQESLDIAYLVISDSIYYGESTLMGVDFYTGLLDNLCVPLIVLPQDAQLHYPEKYAFIGGVTHDCTPYLNQLGMLAAHSTATIMLTSINTGRPLDAEQEIALRSIIKETINKIEYGRIYFRHIANDVAKSDMEWLMEDNRFEALAMVYHKHDIYNQVLSFSFSLEIKGIVNVPLIIFPGQ